MCRNWNNKDEKAPTPQEVKFAGGSFLEWRLLDHLLSVKLWGTKQRAGSTGLKTIHHLHISSLTKIIYVFLVKAVYTRNTCVSSGF